MFLRMGETAGVIVGNLALLQSFCKGLPQLPDKGTVPTRSSTCLRFRRQLEMDCRVHLLTSSGPQDVVPLAIGAHWSSVDLGEALWCLGKLP